MTVTETLRNREGEAAFDATWGWASGALTPGMTAVVRVRDEARSLPWVLPGLLAATDRVLLIDNGSTDGSADLARRVAAEQGQADALDVVDYPFAVARCGADHLATPEDSVHSLAYFYNWCFAQVRTAYALKWDGDMVLTRAAVDTLRDLAWQLEAVEAILRVPRCPLYLVSDELAYLDVGLRNREPWAWPNRPGYRFVKALEWELPLWGSEEARGIALPEWSCVELKHLEADEFAHWTDTSFGTSARTARKFREWTVFRALTEGTALPHEVLEIRAPAGTHVVDFVRDVWLPSAAAGRAPAVAQLPQAQVEPAAELRVTQVL